MKPNKKTEQMLATLGEAERREIKGLINDLEVKGACLCDDDIVMLVNMTWEQRYKFLGAYQRN